ncbi:MAG: DUF4082 domain-containing protein [Acidimicrobiia bacterium]
MNAKFRTASALFATLAVLGANLVTFTPAASADAATCVTACSLRIGHPPDTSTGAAELGLQFNSDTAGWIAGVCFWEAPDETGNHTVSLWDSSGTQLGTATSTIAGTPGLESCVDFNPLVPVAANTTYTASYTANVAYDVDPDQFLLAGEDLPPLHAMANAGVSGSPGAFPTTNTMGNGYGVDVAFIDTQTGITNDCTSTLTAPTSPSSAPGNASATVSWGPAQSTPAGCIAGYEVTDFLNGVAQTQTLIPGLGTTTVISGLTNGQAYTFTIAAESGRSVGPASTSTGPVTVGAPTAPTALTVTRVSIDAVKVAFRPSHNNHAAITKYVATCRSNVGAARSTSSKAGPLTVTGLTRGQTYRCTVRATNGRGNGPWSARSVAVQA